MDSLTQAALGSAVGYAVLGNKIGRKAILWGAMLGTLPDLDVFIPFGGTVEDFTFHRGFSHSFLVHLLISPLLVWLILKIHPTTRVHKQGWFWLVFLILTSHALLDSLTVYGTQLFWPLTEFPVGISSIFIIDPLYTLPLLVGIIFVLWPRINRKTATWMNGVGLVLSSVYLGWTLAAKWHIDTNVQLALTERNIDVIAYESTPAPFNSLLWRFVAMTDNHYYEGFASVYDQPSEISLHAYPTQPELLTDISNEWGVQRLQWFTKGLYSVRQEGSTVVLSDLRMGIEGSYVFAFEVGAVTEGGIQPGSYNAVSNRPDLNQIGMIWDRIWDPAVSLTPAARLSGGVRLD